MNYNFTTRQWYPYGDNWELDLQAEGTYSTDSNCIVKYEEDDVFSLVYKYKGNSLSIEIKPLTIHNANSTFQTYIDNNYNHLNAF